MTIILPVTLRDKSNAPDRLRASEVVPGVVYGPKQESLSISLAKRELEKVMKEAGESSIIQLTGLTKPIDVLIKDVAFNPIKQQVIHVDFYAIEAGKKITTHVPLEFIGEAPVEESKAGSVTHVLQEVTVTCAPADLPSHIDVDVSGMVTEEDKILVSDLKVAKGVLIHEDADSPVAVVSVAKEEPAEVETVEVPEEGAVPEDKKGKEEAE